MRLAAVRHQSIIAYWFYPVPARSGDAWYDFPVRQPLAGVSALAAGWLARRMARNTMVLRICRQTCC